MYDKKEWLQKIDAVIEAGPYTDSWASLSLHQTPAWFARAKFGIFIHWGIYSVPAFGSEWYSRNMYVQDSAEYKHHREVYGDQKTFGYKDFIPLFTAEHFDAAAWISLFKEAGARYVVPVAEHHDGFQMYKSNLSHWNAYEMGPRRDVLGELTREINRQGLIGGASTHRIEHWFFMGHGREFESDITGREQEGDFYWPAMPEGHPRDLYSEPFPSREFLDDWMIRTCELIDRYQIRELYFDWWIQHAAAKPYLKKIAAYYYNRAAAWGKDVLITYKHDSFMYGCAVPDIERGQFASIQPMPWQTDTAIARNSWCYTENNDYKQARDILCDLVDVVSKNGTMLLNVGPKADGTFSREDTKVLRDIGSWLAVNGEAIYDTRPWRIFGEGPTKVEEGEFTDAAARAYTKEDFRFTVKGENLYVFCLSYPKEQTICIHSLAEQNEWPVMVFHGIIESVDVLGYDEKPQFKRYKNGLYIKTQNVYSDKPVVFRVRLL